MQFIKINKIIIFFCLLLTFVIFSSKINAQVCSTCGFYNTNTISNIDIQSGTGDAFSGTWNQYQTFHTTDSVLVNGVSMGLNLWDDGWQHGGDFICRITNNTGLTILGETDIVTMFLPSAPTPMMNQWPCFSLNSPVTLTADQDYRIYCRKNTFGNGYWLKNDSGIKTYSICSKLAVSPTPTNTATPTPTPTLTCNSSCGLKTFLYSNTRDDWFQTADSGLVAKNSISSTIPGTCNASCSPSCSPYLSIAVDSNNPGIVSYSTSLSVGSGNISTTNWKNQTGDNGPQVKFQYLINVLKVDTSANTFTGIMPNSSSTYYSGVSQNISGAFPAGQKIIIFINGDVTVNSNIEVPTGSFFALVSSGKIEFASGVTKAQGLYLADGKIITQSSGGVDSRFEGQGSFIGWAGVELNRNLGAGNNCQSAEYFSARPDLLINAPLTFMTADFIFTELEP